MAKRILTAVVGIAFGITVLILRNTPLFPVTIAALAALGVHELLTACKTGFGEFRVHYIFCQLFAVSIPVTTYFSVDLGIRLLIAMVWAFLMFAGFVADNKKMSYNKLAIMCTSTTLITLPTTCLISLIRLDEVHGPCYVVMALMAAWLPDAGAYFVGSAIGKHKLCPDISPKKTIEGAVGGGLVSMAVFVIYALVYRAVLASNGIHFDIGFPVLLLLVFVCDVVSIFGDLAASLIKREYGIKDFGKLFPGHGGMVDRFDSCYFVLPAAMYIFAALGNKLFIG